MRTEQMLWNNFLALEKRFVDAFYYVEYTESNFKIFSLAFRSIILEACSDIEFIFKSLLVPTNIETPINIGKIHDKLKETGRLDFKKIKIEIPASKEEILPWETWGEEQRPEFWKAYNEIKHEGKLESANLKNARDALAGLFANTLAYYVKNSGNTFSENQSITEPMFFYYNNLKPASLVAEFPGTTVPGWS